MEADHRAHFKMNQSFYMNKEEFYKKFQKNRKELEAIEEKEIDSNFSLDDNGYTSYENYSNKTNSQSKRSSIVDEESFINLKNKSKTKKKMSKEKDLQLEKQFANKSFDVQILENLKIEPIQLNTQNQNEEDSIIFSELFNKKLDKNRVENQILINQSSDTSENYQKEKENSSFMAEIYLADTSGFKEFLLQSNKKFYDFLKGKYKLKVDTTKGSKVYKEHKIDNKYSFSHKAPKNNIDFIKLEDSLFKAYQIYILEKDFNFQVFEINVKQLSQEHAEKEIVIEITALFEVSYDKKALVDNITFTKEKDYKKVPKIVLKNLALIEITKKISLLYFLIFANAVLTAYDSMSNNETLLKENGKLQTGFSIPPSSDLFKKNSNLLFGQNSLNGEEEHKQPKNDQLPTPISQKFKLESFFSENQSLLSCFYKIHPFIIEYAKILCSLTDNPDPNTKDDWSIDKDSLVLDEEEINNFKEQIKMYKGSLEEEIDVKRLSTKQISPKRIVNFVISRLRIHRIEFNYSNGEIYCRFKEGDKAKRQKKILKINGNVSSNSVAIKIGSLILLYNIERSLFNMIKNVKIMKWNLMKDSIKSEMIKKYCEDVEYIEEDSISFGSLYVRRM